MMKTLFLFFALMSVAAIANDRPEKDYRAELKREALKGGTDTKARLKAVIQPLFPSGLDEKQTVSLLFVDFGITDKDLNRTHVDKTPLEVVIDGKRKAIVSWVTAPLLSFRSLRSLGTKNDIGAQFDFDQDGKLVDYMVWVSYGPEL